MLFPLVGFVFTKQDLRIACSVDFNPMIVPVRRHAAVVAKGHAGAQATYVLDKITASLAALGASLQDVVATRIYLADAADCEAVSRVHGRYFTDVRPANLLLEVSRLIGDYRVEIEAEAITTQPVPAPML